MMPSFHFALQERKLEILKTLMLSAVRNEHASLDPPSRMENGTMLTHCHLYLDAGWPCSRNKKIPLEAMQVMRIRLRS